MGQLSLLEDPRTPARTASGGFVPPLKWAGGKRWLVPHIKPLWERESHRRLVEPFAGGLAVTLGLLPRQALLNDINEHLHNFYVRLKAGLVLDINGGATDQTFNRHRAAFNQLIAEKAATGNGPGSHTAAHLFYYLNRHCYNGLCRFNRDGFFNTPNGRYVNPKFERDLTHYIPVLKDWEFTCGDFRKVKIRPGDFVYADPPYDDAFTGYSEGGFSRRDQEDLAKRLAKHDGPVVLSNHATDDMLELYDGLGFNTKLRPLAPRMIHCKGDRTPAVEVVATLNL